jgi:hypothetical protein
MERLWENAERSAAAIKQQQQRPDSQALDYSVCSGRSSIIVSSNNVNHHHNNSNNHLNGHHDNGSNHPTSAIHQLPSSIMTTINGGGRPAVSGSHGDGNRMEEDDEDTPMICMICEDKATGLHYGIITCEG